MRTLFLLTDLFIQFAHVKSVHAHSKINNALLDSTLCAQCCADRCVPLSLSKETDSTALRSPLYRFPETSWCRETITITDKIFAINAEIVWILLSNSLDTLIVKEFNCNMDEMC